NIAMRRSDVLVRKERDHGHAARQVDVLLLLAFVGLVNPLEVFPVAGNGILDIHLLASLDADNERLFPILFYRIQRLWRLRLAGWIVALVHVLFVLTLGL